MGQDYMRNQIVINSLTSLVVLAVPVLTFLVLIFLVVRGIVSFVAHIYRPGLEVFGGLGLCFDIENVNKNPSANLVFHCVCRGSLSVEKLREKFWCEILPISPSLHGNPYRRLTQRWIYYLGYVFWETDSDFRLENHIRQYDNGGTKSESSVSEEELEHATGRLITLPYVSGRSPWEVLIIPSYVPRWLSTDCHYSVMILRIHHGLADGISIMRMISQLANGSLLDIPSPKFRPRVYARKIELISEIERMWKICQDYVVKGIFLARDETSMWHVPRRELRRSYNVTFSGPMEVKKLKAIQRKFFVSYNAVMFSVTLGAITKIMRDTGKKSSRKLTTFYSWPVPDHPGGLSNHFSGDLLVFYPEASTDAVSRLHQVSQSVKTAAEITQTPSWMLWYLKATGSLPFSLVTLSRRCHQFTLMMPNVPGPAASISIQDDCNLVEIIFAAANSGGDCGVTATMASAAGIQRITLCLDEAFLVDSPPPAKFAAYLEREVNDLLDAMPSSVGR